MPAEEIQLKPRTRVTARQTAPKVDDLTNIKAVIEQKAAISRMQADPANEVQPAIEGHFADPGEIFHGIPTVVNQDEIQAATLKAIAEAQAQTTIIAPANAQITGPPTTIREMQLQNKRPDETRFPDASEVFAGKYANFPVANMPVEVPKPVAPPKVEYVVKHEMPDRTTGFICIKDVWLMDKDGAQVAFKKDQFVSEPMWIDLILYCESESFIPAGDLDKLQTCPNCKCRFPIAETG